MIYILFLISDFTIFNIILKSDFTNFNMSFTVQIIDILKSNYDISNISQFIEDNKKVLNLDSDNMDIDLATKEIMSYFKIIESLEEYPVSNEDIKKLYTKPLILKNLQKSFNIQSSEYIISSDDKEEFNFTYSFFKKVLSIISLDKFNILCKLENIIAVDIIKKSLECNSTSSVKPKITMLGLLLKSVINEMVVLEFAKIKKDKLSELHDLVNDKEIILQFNFDKEVDNIKIFDESIKQLFTDKLDIINRKKEREIDSKNLKIKESLDSLEKEERKLKEKDLLLKHCKVSMKSLGINVKNTTITYPLIESFDSEEIINIIRNKLDTYSSVKFVEEGKSSDSTLNMEKETLDDNLEDNLEDAKEVDDSVENDDKQESEADDKQESEADSDNEDLFGL